MSIGLGVSSPVILSEDIALNTLSQTLKSADDPESNNKCATVNYDFSLEIHQENSHQHIIRNFF